MLRYPYNKINISLLSNSTNTDTETDFQVGMQAIITLQGLSTISNKVECVLQEA